MLRNIRLLGFLGLFCAVGMLSSNTAVANGVYRNIPNAHLLLEHLVRHTDELLTEVNLTRANQFLINTRVVEQVRGGRDWAGNFYEHKLVSVERRDAIPEYFIGKMVNDMRMQVIMLYDLWWKFRQPTPALVDQFRKTDWAYRNAISGVYFYIEALRRSFIINGAPVRPWDRDLLIRRLTKLDQLAWEIRELMMQTRYAALFRFPVPRYCPEGTFRAFRVNVAANRPMPFIPFIFSDNNQVYAPQYINPVQPGVRPSGYDMQYWDRRWNNLDQGYIQQYQAPQNVPPVPYRDGGQPGDIQQQPGYQPQQPGYQPQPGYQGPGYQPQPGYQQPGYQPGQQPIQQPGLQQPGQPGSGDQRDILRPIPTNPGNQPGVGPGQQPGQQGGVAPTSDFDY